MEHILSQKAMMSPTQKAFNYMFQWVYHRIDPSYKFQKNIDQIALALHTREALRNLLFKCGLASIVGRAQLWGFFYRHPKGSSPVDQLLAHVGPISRPLVAVEPRP
ncbi:hypothetical protein F5Y16DRAFT_391472 [Xylariaceae sp. FL0255]|nr:hypothetical protein F5Y16DRAFT_391472 [Xylariaceae sp. FL0255]